MSAIIECRNLSKKFIRYKKKPGFYGAIEGLWSRSEIVNEAIAQFDLTIQRGEFVGLLGPNGAGKTTLMKMFTGIIVPSSGDLSVLGFTPFEREIPFRKKIALVMGQKSQLWWDIPALDSFLLLKKYYEIDEQKFKRRLDQLAEVLDVSKLMDIHVRKLSLGERMKMELIASLLHEPDLIFLDEPTIGLDIVAQKRIREFLSLYQSENRTTIILTSHYMADVAALCDRLVLVLGGKKAFDGSLNQFSNILGSEKIVTFEFADLVALEHPLFSRYHPHWVVPQRRVELRIPERDLRHACAQILTELSVSDFSTEQMPIERVMSELIRKPQIVLHANT